MPPARIILRAVMPLSPQQARLHGRTLRKLRGFLGLAHCTRSECVVCCGSARLTGLTVSEVEIRRIEVREIRQPVEVMNEKAAATMVDETGVAQVLQSPVDVHAG